MVAYFSITYNTIGGETMHNELYLSLYIFYIYYLFLIIFFLFSIVTTLVIYLIKIKRNHATVANRKRD